MFKLFKKKQSRGQNRTQSLRGLGKRDRRMRFEELESRQLLSITLPSISSQTVLAGAPLNVVLNGSESSGNALTYSATVTSLTLSGGSLTAAMSSSSNPSLKLSISDTGDSLSGDVIFQLFKDLAPDTVDHIMALVNAGEYDNTTFGRIIEDFMIQGGYSSSSSDIDDEFNSALQFTSSGLLAMANANSSTTSDTGSSQFFITTEATRWLDFRHTIFGIVTQNYDLVDKLDSVSTDDDDAPTHTVTITNAEIITDTQNGVLRLSAPTGVSGLAYVTVTATDSVTKATKSTSFLVTVSADTNNDQAFLKTIDPIETSVNTPVTFTIPATDVEGDAITYSAVVEPSNTNITVSVNSSTGVVTVTPTNNVYGVFSIKVGVDRTALVSTDKADFQYVPVYVSPAKPTTVTLATASDTGSSTSDGVTSLNNASGKTLQYTVDGVLAGSLVQLYAGSTLIGSATVATGATSVTFSTNGTATLADGSYSVTAKQTLASQTVSVGNLSTTTNLVSPASTALTLKVDTTSPQFDFLSIPKIVVGLTYKCQVALLEGSSTGVVYELTTKPDGMTIATATGLITWIPDAADVSDTAASVTLKATDLSGNTATKTFTVTVLADNDAPVLSSTSPSLGSINANAVETITLSSLVTNVTDADTNAALGGIALVGIAGKGAWAFKLSGDTTYTTISSVSESSALLLPSDAVLRYTPNGIGGQTASIKYYAWDTTGGVAAGRSDLSATDATGGITPFSTTSNTALLDVIGTCTISGYVYFDTNNDGNRSVTANLLHPGLQGVVITLCMYTSGSWSSALVTTVTDANGMYQFDNVAAGVYLIRETQPTAFVDGKETRGTIDATIRGQAGPDVFAINLAEGEHATGFNFGERAIKFEYATGRMLMASSARVETFLNTPPTIVLSQSAAVAYTCGGSPVAIAGSASVADSSTLCSSSLLSSMTVTIADPPDGSSEKLDAHLSSDSALASTYANGVLTLSGVASASVYQQALRAVTYENDDTTPTTGNRTITIVASDGTAVSKTTSITLTVSPDTAAPSGYSITPNPAATNLTTIGFTFAGAEVGATYSYTLTDSASHTVGPVTGTVTSATQSITGISISTFSDGAITFSVTLTDKAGNVGSAATTTAVLDHTAPTGYSISPNATLMGTSNVGFTFTAAEVGATYSYTVTDSANNTLGPVTGTVTSATQSVILSSLTGLVDGALTFSVTLTDPAGNAGTAVTTSGTFDGTKPTGYTVTPAKAATNESTIGFTINDAEIGATYSYTIVDGSSHTVGPVTGTIAATSQPLTGISVASMTDGTLTISVTLTDAAGNAGSAVTTTVTLDRVAPASFGVSPAAASMNASTIAFVLQSAEIGTTYEYSITDSASNTIGPITGAVSSASQSISGMDVSSLVDGELTFYVTLIDAAGNEGTLISTTGILDRTPPTGYDAVANTTLTNAATIGFTLTAAEASATYTYTITDSLGHTVGPVTGPVNSTTSQTVSGIDISSLSDGKLTLSVTLTDAAGNTGTAVVDDNITLDRTAPTAYTVTTPKSAMNDTTIGFIMSGAEVGATYRYTISDGTHTVGPTSGTITSATQTVSGMNVGTLSDGAITISVTLTDVAGNQGSAVTTTATLDRVAPADYSITVPSTDVSQSGATDTSFTFAAAELDAHYVCIVSSGFVSVTKEGDVSAANETISGIDVSTLPAGTLTYYVTLTDAAGNVGPGVQATRTLLA
jgi:large repetitive protein